MLYMDYIQKAKELTIEQNDNGTWYLIPEWRYILVCNELALYKFRDFRADWYAIEDNLKLEVEKRNKANDKTYSVMAWADGIVNTTNVALTDEENDLVSKAFDLLKTQQEGSLMQSGGE